MEGAFVVHQSTSICIPSPRKTHSLAFIAIEQQTEITRSNATDPLKRVHASFSCVLETISGKKNLFKILMTKCSIVRFYHLALNRFRIIYASDIARMDIQSLKSCCGQYRCAHSNLARRRSVIRMLQLAESLMQHCSTRIVTSLFISKAIFEYIALS